jgi:c(7)-type cytochrome triheme protein
MIPSLVVAPVAVALLLAAAALAAASGAVPGRGPADFQLKQAESSPGVVTFSHARHVPRVGTCSACHMRDFKMKRGASGPITLAAKEEGRFCGACHSDGKRRMGGVTVFPLEQCDGCHK